MLNTFWRATGSKAVCRVSLLRMREKSLITSSEKSFLVDLRTHSNRSVCANRSLILHQRSVRTHRSHGHSFRPALANRYRADLRTAPDRSPPVSGALSASGTLFECELSALYVNFFMDAPKQVAYDDSETKLLLSLVYGVAPYHDCLFGRFLSNRSRCSS